MTSIDAHFLVDCKDKMDLFKRMVQNRLFLDHI